jgi:murein DD-endopeptidase MepM/ murein hydrolase activator NlpD
MGFAQLGCKRARTWSGLVAVAVALGAALLPAPPAAADARPVVKSPFSCGQQWFARTYPGHPSFAVDWNLPGSGEADFGQLVLAGAPGVVTVDTNAGYGLMVTIDHGDGWSTLYAHLSAVAVNTGQRVAGDTLVGAVGRSGRADGSHLHQEQSFNGVRQPVEVDGHAVVPSFSSRGTSYASANCAARAVTKSWRTCLGTQLGKRARSCGSRNVQGSGVDAAPLKSAPFLW